MSGFCLHVFGPEAMPTYSVVYAPTASGSVFIRVGNSIFRSFRSTVIVSIFRTQKRSIRSRKNVFFESFSFLTVFPLFIPKDRIAPIDLRSLIFFKDRRDRFALVNLWKRSIQPFLRSNRYFDLSITKNDRFDRKTDDRIPNLGFHVENRII